MTELTPRQIQYADAALHLLAAGGMSTVSFRTVAQEAGRSIGAVQKAFPTKDALLAAMFQRMRQVGTPPLGEPGRPTLRGWLVDLLVALLPLDGPRRTAQLQAVAFADRAGYDPGIGAAVAAGDRELVQRLAGLVRRAIAEGEVGPQVDPDITARAWLALAQGLAAQLLYDPRPEDAVRIEVDQVIGRLLR